MDGNFVASETALKGSISVSPEDAAAHPERMCDAGSLTWDLSLDKQIAFNVRPQRSSTNKKKSTGSLAA